MARLGWGGSIATAIGVAAGAGAAQLGFGYGLGIINWAPADAAAGQSAWVASLAWATWISAVSTIAGAVCAQRLHGRGAGDTDDAAPSGTLRRITLAVAGAVGALITVLLVAVPARAAVVAETFSPQSIAAGYAGLGLLVGLLVAVWALHSPAAAGNVIATVGWLWLLAVIAVVDGVLSGRGLATAQLGIWQISADSEQFWIRGYFYWPGAVLSMGSALVIGALAARRSARSAERRVGAAMSGVAGPLLVAIAYFLAVPRLTAIGPEQVSAHLVAPYAVIAGVGGSILVAALAQRAERRAARRGVVTVPRQRTGDLDDALPATAAGAGPDASAPEGGPDAPAPAGRRPDASAAAGDATPTTAAGGTTGTATVPRTTPIPEQPAKGSGRARPAGRKSRAATVTAPVPTDPAPTASAGPPVPAPRRASDSEAVDDPTTDRPGDADPEAAAPTEITPPAGPKSRTGRRTR